PTTVRACGTGTLALVNAVTQHAIRGRAWASPRKHTRRSGLARSSRAVPSGTGCGSGRLGYRPIHCRVFEHANLSASAPNLLTDHGPVEGPESASGPASFEPPRS